MAQNSRTGKVGPLLHTVPQPRNWDEIKPGRNQRRQSIYKLGGKAKRDGERVSLALYENINNFHIES